MNLTDAAAFGWWTNWDTMGYPVREVRVAYHVTKTLMALLSAPYLLQVFPLGSNQLVSTVVTASVLMV